MFCCWPDSIIYTLHLVLQQTNTSWQQKLGKRFLFVTVAAMQMPSFCFALKTSLLSLARLLRLTSPTHPCLEALTNAFTASRKRSTNLNQFQQAKGIAH